MTPSRRTAFALSLALTAAAALVAAPAQPAAAEEPPFVLPARYLDPDPVADVSEWFHNFRLDHFLPSNDAEVLAFVG
ncbi:MAG: hypothetical protein LBS27_04460, partial [Bifidobacteriaceae bacterium]|nr:hypothetical protein [Bifidobacteriaceae bacterium]